MNTLPPEIVTIRQRLETLLHVVLNNSNIKPQFMPIIKTLAKNFLNSTNEENLREGIVELRDKYIPWILEGETSNEAKNENSTT